MAALRGIKRDFESIAADLGDDEVVFAAIELVRGSISLIEKLKKQKADFEIGESWSLLREEDLRDIAFVIVRSMRTGTVEDKRRATSAATALAKVDSNRLFLIQAGAVGSFLTRIREERNDDDINRLCCGLGFLVKKDEGLRHFGLQGGTTVLLEALERMESDNGIAEITVLSIVLSLCRLDRQWRDAISGDPYLLSRIRFFAESASDYRVIKHAQSIIDMMGKMMEEDDQEA